MKPCKKISIGHYLYRGFHVNKVYHPSGICWEAVDVDGSGFAHSTTLFGCKVMIDSEYDRDHSLNEHCSSCVHYESCPNGQMYCKLRQKGLTARTICCSLFEYPCSNL